MGYSTRVGGGNESRCVPWMEKLFFFLILLIDGWVRRAQQSTAQRYNPGSFSCVKVASTNLAVLLRGGFKLMAILTIHLYL